MQNKKRISENVDSLYFHAQPSSLPSFPSLPYSPLSQESSCTRKNSLLQQISSPLVRKHAYSTVVWHQKPFLLETILFEHKLGGDLYS